MFETGCYLVGAYFTVAAVTLALLNRQGACRNRGLVTICIVLCLVPALCSAAYLITLNLVYEYSVLPACLIAGSFVVVSMWRTLQRHRWSLYLLLGFSPLLPYAVVEAQTLLYSGAVLPAIARAARAGNGNHLVNLSSVKILAVTPWTMRVYAVEELDYAQDAALRRMFPATHGYCGMLYELHRTEHGWDDAPVVGCAWSDFGNAQGMIFPPYPVYSHNTRTGSPESFGR